MKKTFYAFMAILTLFAFTFAIVPNADAATFGSEHIVSGSNRADFPSVVALDSTHYVVAYYDTVATNGVAVACHITGTDTVSCGTPVTFNSGATGDPSISALDSTRFVVTYRDPGNLNYGTAIVGQMSSNTVLNFGSENVFASVSISDTTNSVAALSGTRFVVTYNANFHRMHTIVGAVTGTTINSYGTVQYFSNPWTNDATVTAMDSSNFVVAFNTSSAPTNGYVGAGSVSDTTITLGTPVIYNVGGTTDSYIDNFDSTKFVIVYRDINESQYGTALVGTRSGTTITIDELDESVYYSSSSSPNAVTVLDSSRFVVTSRNNGNWYGWTRTGSVSGTTIAYYGSEATDIYNSALTAEMSIDHLGGNDFVVAYRDQSNSNLGTVVLGNEQQGGGGGGAVPEYTTPIAIALALGVGLVIVLVVRNRFAIKKKV